MSKNKTNQLARVSRVYQGAWNPLSGAYPLHNGEGAIWDVVLNDGVENFMFDGKVWGGGHRLGYVPDTDSYHQITSNVGVHSINGKNGAVILSYADVGAAPTNHAHDYVDGKRRINGKPLTEDVVLTHSDVKARPDTWMPTYADVGAAPSSHSHDYVPPTRRINGKNLANDITLGHDEVGAASANHTHDYVDGKRKINGKVLTSDISLSYSDVGAAATKHTHTISEVTGLQEALDSGYEEAPFPDVWIPFSDNLRMLSGYGEDVKVGDEVVATKASFSRASGATYIDKSGALRTAAVNEPRFEKEGLLIEGQSTNIVPNSSIFASLSASGLSYTDSSFGSVPTRIFTHNLVGLAGINYNPNALVANNPVGGTTYTASCVVKLVSGSGVRLRIRATKSDGSFLGGTVFSLDSMSQTTSDAAMGSASSGYRHLGNGYYKLWITVTPSESGTVIHWNLLGDADTAGSVEFGAAQIEALPFATSYIPTNGAAATRAADVVRVVDARNCKSTGLTISAECDTSITSGAATVNSFDFYNKISFTSTHFSAVVGSGTGSYVSPAISHGGSKAGVGFIRITDSGVVVGINGVVGNSRDLASTPPAFNSFYVGSTSNGTRDFLFGHIRNFRIWHRTLSDNQLKGLK